MEFKTVHRYKDYLTSRDEQFIMKTVYENTFDSDFSKINNEFFLHQISALQDGMI